jgi:hypothetical protein
MKARPGRASTTMALLSELQDVGRKLRALKQELRRLADET